MAPVRTPKDIVARWNSEVGKILASPDLKGRFINDGLEPMGGTQGEFERFIRTEIEKYAKVVKAVGLKPQ
jgi:tripartite-type tricarboxylate transporter receptor subunit TctC